MGKIEVASFQEMGARCCPGPLDVKASDSSHEGKSEDDGELTDVDDVGDVGVLNGHHDVAIEESHERDNYTKAKDGKGHKDLTPDHSKDPKGRFCVLTEKMNAPTRTIVPKNGE